jgi:hypothetical protein
MLSTFPLSFDDSMPAFTSAGALPVGDYLPTVSAFELRFVDVGDVARRKAIYQGWNEHRQALLAAGLAADARQLLNGSYTTNKAAPGDIDLAVEVPLADGDAFRAFTPQNPILHLLAGPRMKTSFRCDAYPIYVLPSTDPYYLTVTVKAIEYWTKWFGTTRDGTVKGRVWARTGGLA